MKYREQRLESSSRRMLRASRRHLGSGFVKEQKAFRVEVGNAVFKRLVAEDSRIAELICANLRAFADCPAVPNLIACYDRDVWIEFIEGNPVGADDSGLPKALADLFGTIGSRAPRMVPSAELDLERELLTSLHLLGDTGVLDSNTVAQLVRRSGELLPESVWIGYDYTDPRPSNFLWNDRRELRVVDVESLVGDRLIGCGAAKALLSWMAPHRESFLAELERSGAPKVSPYFEFVELYFLSQWQKRSVLQRKNRHIDAKLFARFCAGHS